MTKRITSNLFLRTLAFKVLHAKSVFLMIFFWSISLLYLSAQGDTTTVLKKYNAQGSDISVSDLIIDKNDRVLVASDQLLFAITTLGIDHTNILDNTKISAVCIDTSNNLYAAGGNKLHIIAEKKVIDLPKDVVISDIEYHNEGIWIGTNQGVFIYDLKTYAWDEYNTKNSRLRSNKIHFITKDNSKGLYIGTYNGFIAVDKNNKWTLHHPNIAAKASQRTEQGVWMIDNRKMIFIDNDSRMEVLELDPNIAKGQVRDFIFDSKGRVYFVSDVLVRYDPYLRKIEKFTLDSDENDTRGTCLAVDKEDKIWLGTENHGLYFLEFETKERKELSASLVVKSEIACHGSPDGRLLLTVAGGVPPYSIRWSDGVQNTLDRGVLTAGKYSVKVTDQRGLSITRKATLRDPAQLSVELVDKKDASATNLSDGHLKVSVSHANYPISYEWSNGQYGPELQNINPGLYTVKIQDNKGCKTSKSFQIEGLQNIPELKNTDVSVGQILSLNELSFKADDTRILPANYGILRDIVDFLNKYKTVRIEIGGHTNTVPPHKYCDYLSQERAKNVANYIISKGIDAYRVKYKGYGKRKPLYTTKSAIARRKNQRVEIKILDI